MDHSGSVGKALAPPAQSAALAACTQSAGSGVLQNCGAAPAISGIGQRLNTPQGAPLTVAGLKGKAVLIDFWAYSCTKDESLTAKANAGITLTYQAADIYLDVGGTGTITATADGRTTTHPVSGAPDIYTLLNRATPERGSLQVTLSPGLSAYSFTFGRPVERVNPATAAHCPASSPAPASAATANPTGPPVSNPWRDPRRGREAARKHPVRPGLARTVSA